MNLWLATSLENGLKEWKKTSIQKQMRKNSDKSDNKKEIDC